jgi:hypothetical protein
MRGNELLINFYFVVGATTKQGRENLVRSDEKQITEWAF